MSSSSCKSVTDLNQCNSNDLVKYCQCQSSLKLVMYNKLKTGANDPSISNRMRYSQIVKNGKRSSNAGYSNYYMFYPYKPL